MKSKKNNLIDKIVLPILRFCCLRSISFCFCNDLVLIRIDFLLVEAAIEKYYTKIGVNKFGMYYIKVVLELWLQPLKIPVTELLKK